MVKKDIYLPHIHYTIRIRAYKTPPNEIGSALGWTDHNKSGTCTVYLPKRKPSPGDVAHELIHVLQYICVDRNMRFELEQEHFGYLMHYLMGQVLGYSYR